MTTALVFAGLSLYAALFLYLCFRDRGRVDRGRIYLITSGHAVKAVVSEETMAAIKQETRHFTPDAPSSMTTLIAPALFGIPIIVHPACGPRTGWDAE